MINKKIVGLSFLIGVAGFSIMEAASGCVQQTI